MPIQFPCTSCGQPVGAMEQQIGQPTSCPTCGAQVIVPVAPGAVQPPMGQAPAYGQPDVAGFAPQGGQPYQQGGYTPAGGFQAQDQGYQVEEGASMGSKVMGRLGGVLGVILVIVLLNVVSYALDCGWVFY